jgi:hypothetical protein
VIRPFLALVSLALLSSAAVAQCAGGVCQVPRAAVVPPALPAAVQTVRAAVANGLYRVGDVIQPVYGVWTPPAQPWYPPLPTTLPQPMAAPPERFVSLYPAILRPLGVQRVDVVFSPPVQTRSLFRPFGGRFR